MCRLAFSHSYSVILLYFWLLLDSVTPKPPESVDTMNNVIVSKPHPKLLPPQRTTEHGPDPQPIISAIMLRFFSVRHIIPTLRDVTNQQNDRRVSFCFLLLTQNWSFLQEFSPEFPTANYLVLRKKKKVSQMLRNLSYLKTLKSSNNNLMLQHPVKKQYFSLYGHIIFTWVLSFLQFLFSFFSFFIFLLLQRAAVSRSCRGPTHIISAVMLWLWRAVYFQHNDCQKHFVLLDQPKTAAFHQKSSKFVAITPPQRCVWPSADPWAGPASRRPLGPEEDSLLQALMWVTISQPQPITSPSHISRASRHLSSCGRVRACAAIIRAAFLGALCWCYCCVVLCSRGGGYGKWRFCTESCCLRGLGAFPT